MLKVELLLLYYISVSPLPVFHYSLFLLFLQAAFRTDLSVLLEQVGSGKESLSFMKRRIRRLAQQWATAANRLDVKLGQRWRDQKKARSWLRNVWRICCRIVETARHLSRAHCRLVLDESLHAPMTFVFIQVMDISCCLKRQL